MTLILYHSCITTPLGVMHTVADDRGLYFLDFEKDDLKHKIEQLTKTSGAVFSTSENAIIHSIKEELNQYFAGSLQIFQTVVVQQGSSFQKNVWRELASIPFGQTISYRALAKAIGRPTAYRAVAQANGANRCAIIIPCHRVINADGGLGGYNGGLSRKQWLIAHELNHCN